MLSIGKLTPGREAYYLDLLGADDYYLNPTEIPGRWVGAAAPALGLAGRVDPDAYRAVLDGRHPSTGAALVPGAGSPDRVPGFDLTFSAPKSVSVLWALADPATAAVVAAAHDRAVDDAVALLEAEAVRARRGHGGATVLDGRGVVAAAFGHRTSRAGDPQLHTHVVAANLTEVDGRWSALYGRAVYAWAKTTGYAYQAALRHHLTTDLGVEWGPVAKGVAEITGIGPAARTRFSIRRAEITGHLDRLGLSGARAASRATLATRPAKQPVGDLDALRAGWAGTAADLGIDTEALTGPGRFPHLSDVTGRLLGADGLTAHASHFDRRAVLQALAESAGDGARPDQLRHRADRLLERPDVVALGAGDPPVTGRRHTTLDLLAVEVRLVERAAARGGDGIGVAPTAALKQALASRPSLGDDQQAVIGSLVTSGAGVEVVVGKAGTGKTYALDAAREAWQAGGHTVVGAALASRAAAQLQAGAGIPATTVARLLADIERPGPLSGLPPRTVVVVDEAGMVGTRTLERLLAHAERARAKVVLVGDPRQLPEIDAGGALAALARWVRTTTLDTNRRQRDDWERAALDQLRSGSVPTAVTAYRDHGRLRLAPSAAAARQALVDDWWAARRAHPDQTAAMYAATRDDVAGLNRRARARMRDAGALASPDVSVAGRDFAVGDEVLCLRNDRRLGVRNGTTGTLTTLAADGATVRTAEGEVTLPGWYLEQGRLTHGYATTLHKAQGATVDRAFLLGSDQLYREAGYVGLSRARTETRLYAVDPGPDPSRRPGGDPLAEMTAALGTSRAQTLAADQAPQLGADALLADPPEWARTALGDPPLWGPDRRRWADTATRVAAARDAHGITDPTVALGPEPDGPGDHGTWRIAELALRTHDRGVDRGLDR